MLHQRAIHVEDKLERRHAILDAARSLLAAHDERIPSVAEVAAAAGVAKGTVYLYFTSKEELFLALHERSVGAFFDALGRLLEAPREADFDAIWRIARQHVVDAPQFLPLATRCFAMLHGQIPQPKADAFRQRLGLRMLELGARVERRFGLAHGEGPVLLRHSYALIVGLWHMSMAHASGSRASVEGPLGLFAWDYGAELERALRALWAGRTGRGYAAAKTPGGRRR